MTPNSLVLVVCHALANEGPLDVNGFPVDGIKLDDATCRNELVQMYDQDDSVGTRAALNFSNTNVCAAMAMREAPDWEQTHPGWYVKKAKCPHPDGTFPGDTDV
jgi:hypothetical protein